MINFTKIIYIIGIIFLTTAVNASNVTGLVTDATFSNCSGGSIDLSVNGGILPYIYAWKNTTTSFSATSQDIQNLVPGQYCVTVTDAVCGTAVACYTVSQSNTGKLVFVSSIKNVTTCSEIDYGNGSITLSTIGTPNCTYKWAGPNNYTSANQSINGLAPGNYTVKIFYPNGCVQTETVHICCCAPTGGPVNPNINYCMGPVASEPIAISIKSMHKPLNISDVDGYIDVKVTGGLFLGNIRFYSWTGPNGFKALPKILVTLELAHIV
jgi:hypothetical protein